jgi:hypothetical protein
MVELRGSVTENENENEYEWEEGMRSGLGKGNQVVTKLLPPSPRLRRTKSQCVYDLTPEGGFLLLDTWELLLLRSSLLLDT